jgi:hypothetical protein
MQQTYVNGVWFRCRSRPVDQYILTSCKSLFGLTDVAACKSCPAARTFATWICMIPVATFCYVRVFASTDWLVRLDVRRVQPWNSNLFLDVFARYCEKQLQLCNFCASVSWFFCVCIHMEQSAPTGDGYESNFVWTFTKTCRPNSSLVKIRKKYRDIKRIKDQQMHFNFIDILFLHYVMKGLRI